MKQNEKILVFAVTGFLVVILLVAIIFGKDGPRVEEPQGGGSTLVRSLEDVLNDRAGNGVATRNPGEDKRMGSDAELAGDPDTAGLAAVDGTTIHQRAGGCLRSPCALAAPDTGVVGGAPHGA